MMKYLKNILPALCLATAICFLLIYTSNDKIGTFNFMLIIFYLVAIMDGIGNIFGLNMHPALTAVVDLIFVCCLVYSIFFLFKIGIKRKMDAASLKRALICLMILFLFTIFICLKVHLTVFTIITLLLFFCSFIVTIYAMVGLIKQPDSRQGI